MITGIAGELIAISGNIRTGFAGGIRPSFCMSFQL